MSGATATKLSVVRYPDADDEEPVLTRAANR